MSAHFHRGINPQSGFTLIELLIVICIGIVLAGVTIATGRVIQMKSRQVASSNNLRQWGTAMFLYSGEHNGALPRRGQGRQKLGQIDRPEDWFNALPSYLGLPSYQELITSGRMPRIGDDSPFICPGVKPATPAARYPLGYGMNMNLSPWNFPSPTLLSQIASPTTVVFMAESPGDYASIYPSTSAYSRSPHMTERETSFSWTVTWRPTLRTILAAKRAIPAAAMSHGKPAPTATQTRIPTNQSPRMKLSSLLAALLAIEHLPASAQEFAAPRPVRVAVINGMIMTGLWQALAERFTKETSIKVELAAAGERPILDEAFRKGGIDFLTMHSGDITTNLVADGLAIGMKPWARNELVIVGPTSDPAGIKGMHDGVAALKQIVARGGKFVDFRDIGSREVFHTLFTKSELPPEPKWLLQDTATEKREILNFAGEHSAYCIVGSLPVRTGRMPRKEMITMVEGDPAMLRPFVLMVANPKHFPAANHFGAAALAAFLLRSDTQKFMATFGQGTNGNSPFFFPVAEDAQEAAGL